MVSPPCNGAMFSLLDSAGKSAFFCAHGERTSALGATSRSFAEFNGHGAVFVDNVQSYNTVEPAIDLTAPSFLNICVENRGRAERQPIAVSYQADSQRDEAAIRESMFRTATPTSRGNTML
jgi:hypothetical protein